MPDESQPGAAIGYLLCDDMIFTSRITGTAQALGLVVRPARNVDRLKALLQQQTPCCVIVDLSNPGLEIDDLITHVRENCSPMPRVVGYGSHVDTATLKNARKAGCDPVLPRSQFVDDLPRALPEWLRSARDK
jgi:DNA-binding NarL/FixJ family response regulator